MKNQELLHKIEKIKKQANLLLFKIDKARDQQQITGKTIPEVEKLIDENNKTIIEQLKIIDELVNLNKTLNNENFDDEKLSEMDYDSYFTLTINNEIPFNKNHPYFKDIRFIKDLMNHYISTEEYEKCIYLQSII
jgi:hypothetical protein